MMRFKSAALLIGGCLAWSGAGAQTPGSAQAMLSSPVAQAHVVIVDDRPWRCEGQSCSGPSGDGIFDDRRSCRDIAQKIGAVSGYESARGALPTDDLARCNKYARSPR